MSLMLHTIHKPYTSNCDADFRFPRDAWCGVTNTGNQNASNIVLKFLFWFVEMLGWKQKYQTCWIQN